MSAHTPGPFWAMPGGKTIDGDPGAIDLKNCGGRLMYPGGIYVEHSTRESCRPYVWVVGERRGIGTAHPTDEWFELDSESTFAAAKKLARTLSRQKLDGGLSQNALKRAADRHVPALLDTCDELADFLEDAGLGRNGRVPQSTLAEWGKELRAAIAKARGQ